MESFQNVTAAHPHCNKYIKLPTLCHKRRFSLSTILGAIAYSDKSASNIPDTIKIKAPCASESPDELRLEPVCINNTKAQVIDTHV